MRKSLLALVAVAVTAVSAVAVVRYVETSQGCSGPAYEDFQQHLASRGATATCADYKAHLAASVSLQEDEPPSAAPPAMVSVPNVLFMAPEVATAQARAAGFTTTVIPGATWGCAKVVVRDQNPLPGDLAMKGQQIAIEMGCQQGGFGG